MGRGDLTDAEWELIGHLVRSQSGQLAVGRSRVCAVNCSLANLWPTAQMSNFSNPSPNRQGAIARLTGFVLEGGQDERSQTMHQLDRCAHRL